MSCLKFEKFIKEIRFFLNLIFLGRVQINPAILDQNINPSVIQTLLNYIRSINSPS